MTRRVLIADDEPLARERIALLLRTLAPALDVREAGNGADAASEILAWAPDAVFLDVQMPELDGFQVVSTVGPARMPATVFVTAFDQHALRAFDVAAVDYLLKPFDDARFAAAWNRLVERRALRAIRDESQRLALMLATHEAGGWTPSAPALQRWTDRLVIKKDQRTYVLPLATVAWAESSGNYVILHAGKERHELRETLTALEARLDPSRFVRVHRRIIVALDAIRELQPWFGGDQVLILKDGTKLRASRSYREHVAQRLHGVV
ncbi:MAG TPA: LytTR family DNA-binding domain-containing protein [Gemmatimonas sp.]|nr:LytTR family DNA-binding domain-containing protein [Gemmatimonas sp.]